MKALEEFDKIIILSVDDDEFNQALASSIFEEFENVTVLEAGNGKEALDMLDSEVVDVILLDILMPIMNGIETLKRLKSNPEYKNIPVIVVTSKEEEKRTTYQLGADDFISKPYSPEELKLRVFNHLRIKYFCDLLYDIKDDAQSQATSEHQLSDLKKAVEIAIGSQKKLLEKLGNIAHENSDTQEKASARLGEYAKTMAKLCGLNSKEIDNLYYCMSIYDIGLLRVPKEDRKNAQSANFKEYPLLGLSVFEDLEETTLIKMAKQIIVAHQENWDGSGYPYGLIGDEIPLYSQIASIVNFYDELTTSRIYSTDTISSEDSLDIIKREKGIKFDPKLLELFIEHFDTFRDIKNRMT